LLEIGRKENIMSQLRSKIAAGLTIVALGGLAGVALSHPQAPPGATQAQSAATSVHHAAPHAAFADDERGGADD
jgi:hypothetical protein